MLDKNDNPGLRQRCFSAKTSVRARPASGIVTAGRMSSDIKTQMMTSIYNGKQKSPPKRNQSAKKLLYQGINSQQLMKYKKSVSKTVTKSKQEIYEQNLQLKQQINRLRQQLAIIKGKMQTKDKKSMTKNKQLDMQFQKQIYWAGSKAHLVDGIKFQYEKLKKQNAQNKAKIYQLNVALHESKLPEYKIYAESVEMENKRLSEQLQKVHTFIKNSLKPDQQNQQLAKDILIAETDLQNKKLKDAIINTEQQMKRLKGQLKEKDKKIQFLQKLLIEKGNNQYHLERRLKKSDKQKQQTQSHNKELQQIISNKQKQHETSEKQIKQSFSRQIQITQIKFDSKVRQKNIRIKHLQDENKHLQNTVHKLRMSSSSINPNNNESFNAGSNRPVRRDSMTWQNKMNKQSARKRDSQLFEQNQINKSRKIDNFQSILSKNEENDHQQDSCQIQKTNSRFRVRKRADKKNSQASKRMRKVQFGQVQEIGQIIKYRFINLEIAPNKIKSYFSYKNREQNKGRESPNFVLAQEGVQSKQNQGIIHKATEWDEQYISMHEAVSILSEYPFSLDIQSAYLLGRYIVEDCLEEYVYCDLKNENNRRIVKSIIKTVIGEYSVPTKQSKQAAKEFMNNYQTNFESALRTYYPNGKVTKRKFLDTLNGLGVGVSEQTQQILLAKAAGKSKNLQQLQYSYLFMRESK